jgi:hypothetical protein
MRLISDFKVNQLGIHRKEYEGPLAIRRLSGLLEQ